MSEILSYDEIDTGCQILVEQIENDIEYAKPEIIIGLIRGGSIPATMLAYKLGISRNHVFHVSYSSSLGKGEQQHNNPLLPIIDKNILLVEDIIDSGHTLKETSMFYQQLGCLVRTASIVYKDIAVIKPTYYYKTIDSDSPYIYFGWDKYED